MKHNLPLSVPLFVCLLLCGLFVQAVRAQSPKREFRATWIATVANIDWPSTKVTTSGNTTQIKKQKDQLTSILDALQAGNINAVCLQVRPTSDAFYPSALSPWSEYLTGARGKDPGYDPLAFAIQEAHKRGIELHAWFNPFRYERSSSNTFGNVDIRASHPDWIIQYNNGSFSGTILDPGLPEVRQYLKEVIGELIANYDIDGILADDYFYPYGGTTTEDAASKAVYKPAGMSDGDWRRQNVNQTIEGLYDTIQAVKPWVRFGMAPFGIWTTKSSVAQANGISLPSGISGSDAYNQLFCDPIAWIRDGYVDYISPQIYWPTTSTGQSYTKLCEWWGQQVCKHFSDMLPDGKQVHLYVSHNDYSDWVSAEEEGLQVDANRQYCPFDAPGSIFYNTTQYRNKGLVTDLKNSKFQQKALPPAMSWKAHEVLDAPYDMNIIGTLLTWEHDKADRFAVYVYPKGMDAALAMSTSAYLVDMVYDHRIDLAGSGDLTDRTIAVCAVDRYGNEFEAAFCNEEEPVEPEEPQEGTLSRIELWRKTAEETGVMSDFNNRSIAYYDGKLYMADGAGSRYFILNAATGAVEQTVGLPSQYFLWHNLRITGDGRMLFGNSATGDSHQYVYACNLGGSEPENVASYYNSGFGRADYFYPFEQYAGCGFLLMLCNYNHKLLKMNYLNGVMGSGVVVTNEVLPSGISGKAVPRGANTFFASVANSRPTLHSLASGAMLEDWTGDVRPEQVDVSGLAYFVLGGREFLLLPADIRGAVATYDITDGLPGAVELLTVTDPLGESDNKAYTIDFAVHVDGYDAYVYELAPANGIAAYKYTFEPSVTGIVAPEVGSDRPDVSKRLTEDGLVITVSGHDYTPAGVQIE